MLVLNCGQDGPFAKMAAIVLSKSFHFLKFRFPLWLALANRMQQKWYVALNLDLHRPCGFLFCPLGILKSSYEEAQLLSFIKRDHLGRMPQPTTSPNCQAWQWGCLGWSKLMCLLSLPLLERSFIVFSLSMSHKIYWLREWQTTCLFISHVFGLRATSPQGLDPRGHRSSQT